jgi:hypothetical protein
VSRIDFEFVGTTCKALSLDPTEFKGQTIPQIAGEVMKVLSEMAPDVNFFVDDVVLAAEQIANETEV